jgi:hypothetical protein
VQVRGCETTPTQLVKQIREDKQDRTASDAHQRSLKMVFFFGVYNTRWWVSSSRTLAQQVTGGIG